MTKFFYVFFTLLLVSLFVGSSGCSDQDQFDLKENDSPKETKGRTHMKWTCVVCDYCYSVEEGDPDNGVPPHTYFMDLPEDWCCPVCESEKDMFRPIME
ncbi:rubredoxin [Dysgonomonas sp. BGC7]|uniref:rubredoxin n=1 Tax=Dysgonomonas sp. BGC7 TaxID=1658008 RepID=UPI000AB1F307